MNIVPDDATLTRSFKSLEANSDSCVRLSREEGSFLQVQRTAEQTYSIQLLESEGGTEYFLHKQVGCVALALLLGYAHGHDIMGEYPWRAADGTLFPNGLLDGVEDDSSEQNTGGAKRIRNSKWSPDEKALSESLQRPSYHEFVAMGQWLKEEFSSAELDIIHQAHEAAELRIAQSKKKTLDEEIAEMLSGLCAVSWYSESDLAEMEPPPFSYGTSGEYLSVRAIAVNAPETRSIALRLAAKSKSLLDKVPFEIIKRRANFIHVSYNELMSVYYDSRDEVPGALEQAIACANTMIRLAPLVASHPDVRLDDGTLPPHEGYEQLILIREEQGDFFEALLLAREAQSAGWAGDWEERIARYEKQLAGSP